MVRTFRVYTEKLSDGRWKCIFCPHKFGAGTSGTRIRWHLSGVEGEGVEICRQVPKNVQEEALQACPNKKRKTIMSDSEMDEMIRELQQGAEGNVSFAGAENHIDDMNGETIQLLADEVRPVIENSWGAIHTLSTRNSGTISTSLQVQNDEVAEADPFDALRPSSSNINVSSATSTSPQAQNTEVANPMSILEPDEMIRGALLGTERNFSFAEAENHTVQTILRSTAAPESLPVHEHDARVPVQNNEDSGTQQEVGEERYFSGAEARNRIENRTGETSQHIQRSITPQRPPVDEHETREAAVRLLADEVSAVIENSWDAIRALSMRNSGTISTSLQVQNDEVAEADPFDALQPLFGKLMSEWESRLLLINAMLGDAEQKPETNQAMKIWLSKLRDLAYDVEDVLDEFQTEALKRKLKSAESQASTSTVQEFPPTFLADPQSSAPMLNSPKLQKIAAGWEDIWKEKNDLGLDTIVRERSNAANQRVFTTSLVKEPKVYGREKAKDDLVELLMKSESSNSRYSVIPIVGMGGIGKTTLAQLAYNDERVEFGYKAWVCVSDDFDITRLTKSILRGIWETHDLNVLQEQLKEKLHGKKFFIVLDDVWDHTYEDWTTLCAPFAAGAPGSKIIITTRGADVAKRIGSVDPYMLKELPYDECLCLFAQHAVDAENFDSNPDLKEAGKKIVGRCKGLPLAAKTLGGLLRHKKNLEDWEDILNSDLWELSEAESVILSALKLSYLHLPSHLKRCFAYCAIFPKDFKFDENELVLLWMAEGFLQKTEQKKQGIELGHKYFKDLLSRSLFQECSEKKSRYVMHDLISDLAQSVSGEICFHLDDKKSGGATSYPKVRHLSFTSHKYDTSQRFEAVYEMESLRTFLAISFDSPYGPHYLSKKVLDDMVPKLKCLRALSLACYLFEELPRSIGALKHLRYLNLSHTRVQRLPESLGELLNLQTLILCGCTRLKELPAWIGNLIHLQHLDIPFLQKMPLEISKLKNLRFMPKFVIGDGTGLGIGELMRLPNLQGELHITGLDRVANIQDAKLANLKERKGLGELTLEGSYWLRDAQHDKQVLSSLEPHRSLEKLSIISYGGTEFPSWVGNSSFSKMVELKLHNCRKVTSLPSLVKLSALRHLSIKRMDVLKEVVMQECPSLESLIIEDMLIWEKWSWSHGLEEDAAEKFPKLRELRLKNCPMFIVKLPSCLPSLKKLHIYECPHLTELPKMLLSSLCELDVKFCGEVTTDLPRMRLSLCDLIIENCDEVIFRMVPNFTSIRRLEIRKASGLVGLGESFVQALVALEDLVIKDCNELKYLWQDGSDLNKFANLKRLEISSCYQLVSLVEAEEGLLPCNLQVLSLWACFNLEKLPNGLHHLTSLQQLTIGYCHKLVSFPEGSGVPYTLKSLRMTWCDSMESLPDRMMTDTVMSSNNSNQCLLENLMIAHCPSLKSFARLKLPTKLKKLYFQGCEVLESEYWFLEGIMRCDARDQMFHSHSHSHLERLSLSYLSLTSFPAGELPTCLKTLEFYGCGRIQSLPSLLNLSHLTRLEIRFCYELESFSDQELPLPNLTSLSISSCKKLRSLPNHMDSLQRLEISSCRGLVSFPETGLPPKLTSLEVTGCENLRQPISEWRLQTLTSLERLEIEFTSHVDYFPDDDGLLLPTSLTSLRIFNQKTLKSISSGIQHLISLEYLGFWNCPQLHVLPNEGFPATLGKLFIRSCPLLEERCLKDKGDYWPIIAHIPEVSVIREAKWRKGGANQVII